MKIEKTLIILKPDVIERNIISQILNIWEKTSLKLVGMKMTKITHHQAESLYEEHRGKNFFPEIVSMMTNKPVLLMCLEGENAIELARKIIGTTDPKEAEGGTIRQIFGIDKGNNAIHGSDSLLSAKKEIKIFFEDNEIFAN